MGYDDFGARQMWAVARNLPNAPTKDFASSAVAFAAARQMARSYAEAVITEPDGSVYVLRRLDS